MEGSLKSKRERAEKRVKELKGFYRHVRVFIVINGIFLLLQSGLLLPFLPDSFPKEPYFFSWVTSNILIWGIILIVHALYTFRNKLPFLKQWEEKQIKKILEEEESNSKKYR